MKGRREGELPGAPAAPASLDGHRRLAAEERDEPPRRGAGSPEEAPGAGAGDGEPAGGRARLAPEEIGDDADVGAEAHRLAARPLDRRPDVGEEEAPALPAVARDALGVRREEPGADGGRHEREEAVGLEDRERVPPRRRDAERRARGDEVPALVAEVREDERDDVGGARGGGEPASLDARERAPHEVDVRGGGAGGGEEVDRPRLVVEADLLPRERHQGGGAAREEDEEEVVPVEPRGEVESRSPRGDAPLVGDGVGRREEAADGRGALLRGAVRRDDEGVGDERAEGPVRGRRHRDGGLPGREEADAPRDEDELATARVGDGARDDGAPPPGERLGDEPAGLHGGDRRAVEGPEERTRIQGTGILADSSGAAALRESGRPGDGPRR